MQSDNMNGLVILTTAAIDFSIVVLLFSFISALLLQAAHEVFRHAFNQWAVQRWLSDRASDLSVGNFVAGMSSKKSLFSLPYWQLTGQINAILGTQLNIDPRSDFIRALAGSAPSPTISVIAPPSESTAEDLALRDIAARAQTGINSLHANLRAYWNMFDYYVTFAIIFVVSSLMVYLTTDRDRFFLYVIAFFAWLATPIVRRMLERLVPFR